MKKQLTIICMISLLTMGNIGIVYASDSVKTSVDTENNTKIPQAIIEMIKKTETQVLIEYYYDICQQADYYTRKIDITEDISTDDVPLFLQWDKRWAFRNYGKKTMMATSGCAPTCLSMAICHFTKDTSLNPKAVADFSYTNNFYIEYVGTREELFTKGASNFGLACQPIKKNVQDMRDNLDEGKLIIALMGEGHFTDGGHYMIIKGYDNHGYFMINDPNSLNNSLSKWSPEVIIGEAKKLWSLSI